jgi:hypothetical protein
MKRRALRMLGGTALCTAIGGCFTHQDVAMSGNADGVMINYVGNVAETLPLARRHCAQYEREPVLRVARDNTATYACIRVSSGP